MRIKELIKIGRFFCCLHDDDVFGYVVELPVSQFVGQHCQHLLVAATFLFLLFDQLFLLLVFRGVVFQQSVEEHNPLVVEESIEVRVAVH
jgi:hypothetical protein